jgi:fibronectin type 3 domain-containing protein
MMKLKFAITLALMFFFAKILSAQTTQPTQHKVTLTWDAQSGVTFNIYRGAVTGGPYSKLTASPIGSSPFVDSTVANGTTYFYVATAVNGSGLESVNSSEVKAIIPAPPGTPGSGSCSSGALRCDLTWTAPASVGTGLTGYKVYRADTAGGPYTQIGTVTAPATTFSDATVAAGKTYFWVVVATGPGGDSAKSNEFSATIPTPPGAPTNLRGAVAEQ